MPTYIQSHIKLTIGILVSNRIAHIRNVMEALRPLLSEVSSELIAVDTKGAATDGSIDIVREYTDKIYPFTWCDDFAAARNVCIDHARGEWFMFLDDDEVFDDVQELIDFFQSGEYLNYGSGYYYVRNYTSDGGYNMGIVGRMVRRTANTRFVGKVHEHFNEVYEPHKEFSCFVHHYGYAFKNEEEKKQHQNRNVRLLQKELASGGMTPRNCAQMVQELYSCEDTREAGFAFCQKSIQELRAKGLMGDALSQWLLAASVRYYKMKNDYQGLLNQAQIVMEQYPTTQMGRLVVAGIVVEASAPQGNVRAILAYAPLYLDSWIWLNAHPKEAITQNQLGMSNYRDEDYAIQVFQAAATCANAVKDYEQANQYWQQLPWDKEGFDGTPYYAGLQETLAGLKTQEKREVLDLFSVLNEACPVVRTLLETSQNAQAVELLTIMQELIITIGNKIEQVYGETEATAGMISVLEQCCEKLWQCANAKGQEALALFGEVEQGLREVEVLCLH